MTTDFRFAPLEYITVNLYGLNYPGRVVSCGLYPLKGHNYEVQYIVNGEFKTGYFHEDELSPRD